MKLEKPARVISLDCDSSFTFTFPEVLSFRTLFVVNDTILLIYNNPSEHNGNRFYHAYSMSDYSYLGSHLRNGRGPGEVLSPLCGGSFRIGQSENRCEYIFDISLCRSYAYDFPGAIESGKDLCYPVSDLPAGTMYANSYRDSLQFILRYFDNEVTAHLLDSEGKIIRSPDLYRGVSVQTSVTFFSSGVEVNNERGLVAMTMGYLPQINILNPLTGEISSHAVDRRYRDWKKIISISDVHAMMNAPLCYGACCSTSEYIMAAYKNLPSSDLLKEPFPGTHIHIFNWDGEFLCDISVKEHIYDMVYDSVCKYLYTLVSDEKICRYDLSGIV